MCQAKQSHVLLRVLYVLQRENDLVSLGGWKKHMCTCTNLFQTILIQNGTHNEASLEKCVGFLHQSGITLSQLDQLGVIHVAGTKGKGSTCALTESILRQRKLKTGLFTSPHLVSFRERIRINGLALNKNTFAKYFWMVYKSIVKSNPPEERPTYFQFFTILAYNVFVREGVDVAIIEGMHKINSPANTQSVNYVHCESIKIVGTL